MSGHGCAALLCLACAAGYVVSLFPLFHRSPFFVFPICPAIPFLDRRLLFFLLFPSPPLAWRMNLRARFYRQHFVSFFGRPSVRPLSSCYCPFFPFSFGLCYPLLLPHPLSSYFCCDYRCYVFFWRRLLASMCACFPASAPLDLCGFPALTLSVRHVLRCAPFSRSLSAIRPHFFSSVHLFSVVLCFVPALSS
jgi:hypothetical protein